MNASAVVTGGFVLLPLLVSVGFVLAYGWAGRRLGEDAGARRASRNAPRRGRLRVAADHRDHRGHRRAAAIRCDTPPFAGLALAVGILGVAVPLSPVGTLLVRGLPLWFLVGFQVFRFPLELLMHRAYVEGVMPVQMSYSGRNYDIVTGITAGVLGLWLARRPVQRWVVMSWNILGFVLLANIVTIAIVSTPVFGWFGRERLNTFVTYPPFVWLPAILVTAALMGHILVWRWLSETARILP